MVAVRTQAPGAGHPRRPRRPADLRRRRDATSCGRRATSTPRTASSRWTCAGTSPPGRLSELVGADDDALKADAVVRTLGWRRVAQQELERLSPARAVVPRGLRGRRQRLPARQVAVGAVGQLHAARRRNNPLPRDRAVDAGRLAGLAQGDGVGPPQQLHGGAGAGARDLDGQERHARRPALPAVPVRRAPADRPGREENGGGSARAEHRHRVAVPGARRTCTAPPAPRPVDDAAERARQAGAAAGDAVGRATTAIQGQVAGGPATPTGSVEDGPEQRARAAGVRRHRGRRRRRAAAARPRRRRRLELLGDLRRPHDTGKPLLANDPHLEHVDAGDLVPDRACTAGRRRRSARSTSPGSASPACPGS